LIRTGFETTSLNPQPLERQMNTNTKPESSNQSFFLLTVILGLLTAMGLVMAGSRGTKWLVAVFFAIMFFYGLLIVTRNFKQFFLALAVFCLPIRLNVHLIYKMTPYSQHRGMAIGLFDVILISLILYWLLQLLLRQQKFKFYPIISVPALAYLTLAGISAFFSQDKILSFVMFIILLRGFITFLYFANNVRSEKEILLILAMLISGVLLQFLVGILQYYTGGTLGLTLFGEGDRAFRTTLAGAGVVSRIGATIGAPNSLAMYLNFILPMILCFIFIRTKPIFRWIAGITFILGGLTEVLTMSRGGWVALTFAVIIALYGIFKKQYQSRVKSYVLTMTLILFITLPVIGTFVDVQKRLFEDDYGAAYGRVPQMKIALNIIAQHPFTGIGLNNYTTVMNRYDRTRENKSYQFPYPVHNAFLLIAAESGLLALFCFLLIFVGILKKAALFFKSDDQFLSILGIGSFCGVITWLIHSQFRMDYANNFLWFFMGLLVAINQLILSQKK
jgi:O-antigen ligase